MMTPSPHSCTKGDSNVGLSQKPGNKYSKRDRTVLSVAHQEVERTQPQDELNRDVRQGSTFALIPMAQVLRPSTTRVKHVRTTPGSGPLRPSRMLYSHNSFPSLLPPRASTNCFAQKKDTHLMSVRCQSRLLPCMFPLIIMLL